MMTIIKTPTRKDFIEVGEILILQGLTWSGNGDKGTNGHFWDRYRTNTCVISRRDTKMLTYCSIEYARYNFNVKIISVEEYTRKNKLQFFKLKYDLK